MKFVGEICLDLFSAISKFELINNVIHKVMFLSKSRQGQDWHEDSYKIFSRATSKLA